VGGGFEEQKQTNIRYVGVARCNSSRVLAGRSRDNRTGRRRAGIGGAGSRNDGEERSSVNNPELHVDKLSGAVLRKEAEVVD
jgi:hypothetical protein